MKYTIELEIPAESIVTGHVLTLNYLPPQEGAEAFTYSTYDGLNRQEAMGMLSEYLDALLQIGREYRSRTGQAE